jgi:hypothetical protein
MPGINAVAIQKDAASAPHRISNLISFAYRALVDQQTCVLGRT